MICRVWLTLNTSTITPPSSAPPKAPIWMEVCIKRAEVSLLVSPASTSLVFFDSRVLMVK